jgi:hypothetical protein
MSVQAENLGNRQPNLWKTERCKFFPRNQCRFGQKCTFAHCESELKPKPDLFKTSLCRDWEIGKCNKGDKCSFAHGTHEKRQALPSGFQKTCPEGKSAELQRFRQSCTFARDPSEPDTPLFISTALCRESDVVGCYKADCSVAHGAPEQLQHLPPGLQKGLAKGNSSEHPRCEELSWGQDDREEVSWEQGYAQGDHFAQRLVSLPAMDQALLISLKQHLSHCDSMSPYPPVQPHLSPEEPMKVSLPNLLGGGQKIPSQMIAKVQL